MSGQMECEVKTGYWGAWYRDGETVYKTNDLSLTFHIVSYGNGDVRHHDRIARTTFGIRNVEYPYGWDTGGTQNNHHAYDVARIINLVWDELDTISRARANASLYLMTARSVALSVNGDGVFDPRPYTSVPRPITLGSRSSPKSACSGIQCRYCRGSRSSTPHRCWLRSR